jgi:excisionase family DNA binding protein
MPTHHEADSPRAAYRVPDAARQLSISERHCWRLIQLGELTPVARIGRLVLVPESTITEFLKRNLAPA